MFFLTYLRFRLPPSDEGGGRLDRSEGEILKDSLPLSQLALTAPLTRGANALMACHSEERSDEESLVLKKESERRMRFLAGVRNDILFLTDEIPR